MSYDIGDQIRLSVAFAAAGVATNPTAINLTIRKPDDTASTVTYASGAIIRDSTGNYHYDVTIDQSGNWYYTWTGTGALVTSEAGDFYVRVRRA